MVGDKVGKDKLGEQTRRNTWRGHLQLYPDLSEYLGGVKNPTYPSPQGWPQQSTWSTSSLCNGSCFLTSVMSNPANPNPRVSPNKDKDRDCLWSILC